MKKANADCKIKLEIKDLETEIKDMVPSMTIPVDLDEDDIDITLTDGGTDFDDHT